jgi:hypothetical protein
MPRLRYRRLHEGLQLDLFGLSHVMRPATTPTWQQLPEAARTTATSLIVRLLVEHTGGDLRSGSIGGRDDA